MFCLIWNLFIHSVPVCCKNYSYFNKLFLRGATTRCLISTLNFIFDSLLWKFFFPFRFCLPAKKCYFNRIPDLHFIFSPPHSLPRCRQVKSIKGFSLLTRKLLQKLRKFNSIVVRLKIEFVNQSISMSFP